RDVEVHVPRLGIPAEQNLAEHAVTAPDLQEGLRRGGDVPGQRGPTEQGVQVPAGPAVLGAGEPVVLRRGAPPAFAVRREVERPPLLIPGETDDVEVARGLEAAGEKPGQPGLV